MNWSEASIYVDNGRIYPVPPVMKSGISKQYPPVKQQEQKKKKEEHKDKNGKTFQDYLDELAKKDE